MDALLDVPSVLRYTSPMSEQLDQKAVQARRKAERAARRKAELQANMARRKAQVRGRGASLGLADHPDQEGGADMPPEQQE